MLKHAVDDVLQYVSRCTLHKKGMCLNVKASYVCVYKVECKRRINPSVHKVPKSKDVLPQVQCLFCEF